MAKQKVTHCNHREPSARLIFMTTWDDMYFLRICSELTHFSNLRDEFISLHVMDQRPVLSRYCKCMRTQLQVKYNNTFCYVSHKPWLCIESSFMPIDVSVQAMQVKLRAIHFSEMQDKFISLHGSVPSSEQVLLILEFSKLCAQHETTISMATDFKSIPVIDVAPLISKCDDPGIGQDPSVCEVVSQLDQACREAGFFYVKGHGIPELLIKEVRSVTREYFDLAFEEKIKIKMSPATGYRGYQRVGENVTEGVPDMHEAIDCYKEVKPGMYGDLGRTMEGPNLWPDNPQKFKLLMEEYIDLCKELSRKIMRGIALALGGPADLFEGSIAGDAFWVMRLIGYPALLNPNGNKMSDNDIGCGAHTDYGLLTLVNQDDDKTALQVKNKSGEWLWAAPIRGTFVCNIGDMLKILSNGLYESTLHRVINNSPKYRVCVAFFYETNFDASVEPLDICKQKVGGIKKFERAVYGEHLVSKVTTNFAS